MTDFYVISCFDIHGFYNAGSFRWYFDNSFICLDLDYYLIFGNLISNRYQYRSNIGSYYVFTQFG